MPGSSSRQKARPVSDQTPDVLTYDRRTVLSLRLRGKLQLRRLTRAELFSRMQVMRVVEPITHEAYKQSETAKWEGHEDSEPHGQPWHISFHASQFPGDDPLACPRQALYQMMDFAPAKPFTRKSRTTMNIGKAIEVELVRTWEKAELLLSASPDDPLQTNFQHPEAWLTGSVDSVIKPPNWNRPLPVEIKTKAQRKLDLMRVGAIGPDPAHVTQLKTQLALVRLHQDELWPGLDSVEYGMLFYISRDDPTCTAEFRVDFDQRFFDMGVERLKEWAAWFQEGVLPSVNPSKKHPMGWRWSYPPCVWCNFKKTCQLDHEQNRTDLTDSIGVDRTRKIRPDYDPEAARLRVLARWRSSKEVAKLKQENQDGNTKHSDTQQKRTRSRPGGSK